MAIETKNKLAIKKNQKTRKKVNELNFSQFFIDRFNHNYNLSYHVVPNTKEADDVDIRAVSDKNTVLNLQLKTGEPGLERFWGEREKHGSGMATIDGNIEDELSQMIKDGEQHYANRKNLIFLITGKFLFDCDEIFAQYLSRQLADSAFMGVYLVKFHAGFNIKTPLEDYVVAIKDIFGNHGNKF